MHVPRCAFEKTRRILSVRVCLYRAVISALSKGTFLGFQPSTTPSPSCSIHYPNPHWLLNALHHWWRGNNSFLCFHWLNLKGKCTDFLRKTSNKHDLYHILNVWGSTSITSTPMQMVSVTLSAASSLSPEHTMTPLRYARLTARCALVNRKAQTQKLCDWATYMKIRNNWDNI